MKTKVKIMTSDGIVADKSATVVNFQTQKDEFSEYILEDGTVIKLKQVLVGVAKVDDETDKDGNPIYSIQTQTVASTVYKL